MADVYNLSVHVGGAGGGRVAGGGGGVRTGRRPRTTGVGSPIGADVQPGRVGRQFGRYVDVVNRGQKKMSRGQARFNFELLSTMFLGMQIQRIFGGMVSQVTDLMGFGKIMKALLISLLSPVLRPLLSLFVKIAKIVMGLPKPVKNLLGALIISGALLGTFLFLGSQLLLAFSGIAAAASSFVIALSLGTGAVGVLGAGLSGAVFILGLMMMYLSAALALFYGLAIWASTLEDRLRNIVILIAEFAGLSGFRGTVNFLSGTGLEGRATNAIVNITQNNTGGFSQVQANRSGGMLEQLASSVTGALGLS